MTAPTLPTSDDEARYRRFMRRLAPRLQREGEEELLETFRQVHARARPDGRWAAARFWLHMAADLIVASIEERVALAAHRRGRGGVSVMSLLATLFTALMMDLRSAARRLMRTPGWTLLAASTLALGLGASVLTAVLVRDVLLRPLPFPNSDRLVRLIEIDEKGGTWWPSFPNAADWRDRAHFLDGIGIADGSAVRPVVIGTTATRVPVSRAARGFFETLGVKPIVGRLFDATEQRPGGPAAVLVSETFWRYRLGAQTLGSLRVGVDSETYDVVGVLPEDLQYFGEGTVWSPGADVWLPMDRSTTLGNRTSHGYHVVARLKPGATLERAREDMNQLAKLLKSEHRQPTQADSVRMTPLRDYAVRSARAPLTWLQYAGIGVLIVTCLNLAGTLLAQGMHRYREFAIRLSLGARRSTLIRHLAVEAALLAVPGVLIGLLLAGSALRVMTMLGGSSLPRLNEVSLDASAVGLAIAAALASATFAGIIPALALSRRSSAQRLRTRGAIGDGRGHRRLWTTFVVLQIALTVTLLCGAGLLLRSLRTASNVDLGYKPQSLFAVDIEMPLDRFKEPERRAAFYADALARLRGTPGIIAAGLTSVLPNVTTAYTASTHRDQPDAKSVFAGYRIVDPGYFAAIGMPTASLPPDAFGPGKSLIDERLKNQLWAEASPIGDRVANSFSTELTTVTGVVGTIREWQQGDDTVGVVYVDYRQRPLQTMHFVVRATAANPVPLINDAFAALDPLVPVTVTSFDTLLADDLGGRRLTVFMTMGFGLVALVLAFSAIYALVSFAVARGQRETAIRLALGAHPAAIKRRVLTQGVVPAACGAIAGLLLTMPLASVIQSQLFHIRASDPVTLAASAVVAVVAGLMASILPSRRAARANPLAALRSE